MAGNKHSGDVHTAQDGKVQLFKINFTFSSNKALLLEMFRYFPLSKIMSTKCSEEPLRKYVVASNPLG